jgi:hypothetical protein
MELLVLGKYDDPSKDFNLAESRSVCLFKTLGLDKKMLI